MVLRDLLHYRLLEKIGEGGMGKVYSALDTHLDRMVAIKVLPPEAVADPGRRDRFVKEAKAASALHHPNIVVVHDIAQDQGEEFIVMEYVQGRTLDEVIGRKGLKLGEALGYAVQIADGLARAHAAGIVHRDLKPTNVMVADDGRVKILDFGLAKLLEEPTGGEETATVRIPDKPETEEGYIVGTAAYMSPEQAEGKKVDARSDIFSFGALLYEMLTGAKAFQRGSQVATLAAVLRDEARPASAIVESLPAEVEQLVSRCLRKDPQRRWQSMSDLKVVLQDLKDDSDSGKLRAPLSSAGSPPRRRLWPFVAGGAVLVLAAVVAWLVIFKKPPAPAEYEITRLTFESGAVMGSAVSPDGKMFAYATDRAGNGDMDIWVQQVSGETPLRLTEDPANDWYPSFSPDGTKVVFRSERDGGGIFVVNALGGQALRLTDRGMYPRFSPDGAWISYVDCPASLDVRLNKMFLVPPSGGQPQPFLPEFSVLAVFKASAPVWSPDGRRILFLGMKEDDPSSSDWWSAPVSGGTPVRAHLEKFLSDAPFDGVPYAWDGGAIYFSTGVTIGGYGLFRVPIDAKTFQVSGTPQRLASDPGVLFTLSIDRNGGIVYSAFNWIPNIFSIAFDPGSEAVSGAPVPLSRDLMVKLNPTVSLDGSRAAYEAYGSSIETQHELRWKDFASGQEGAIPVKAGILTVTPRFSLDGSKLAYSAHVSGGFRTFLVPPKSSASREICSPCLVLGFYGDPGFLLVSEGRGRLLSRLETATGNKTPVLTVDSGRLMDAQLSPDDRWLVFETAEPDGRLKISVAALSGLPGPGRADFPIYEDDHFLASPQWSPDGRTLYFLSERDGWCCIWGRRLDAKTKTPRGEVFPVYHSHRINGNLNFPPGSARMAVARDKIVFFEGQFTGTIYRAAPKKGQ